MGFVRLSILCLAWAATGSLAAQTTAHDKVRVYTYVAEWDVPRAQWGDMTKLDELDKPLLDKLIADGTLIGYGAHTNLIHQEGEPTHGSWLSATSEGNILKALESIYAHPGSVSAPVQGASKHWDQMTPSQWTKRIRPLKTHFIARPGCLTRSEH
jgi:hypothetical protein